MLFTLDLYGQLVPIIKPLVIENYGSFVVATTIDDKQYNLAQFSNHEDCQNYISAIAYNISLNKTFCVVPNKGDFSYNDLNDYIASLAKPLCKGSHRSSY